MTDKQQYRRCSKIECPEHYSPKQLVKKELETYGYCNYLKDMKLHLVTKDNFCIYNLPLKQLSQSLPKCTPREIMSPEEQMLNSIYRYGIPIGSEEDLKRDKNP